MSHSPTERGSSMPESARSKIEPTRIYAPAQFKRAGFYTGPLLQLLLLLTFRMRIVGVLARSLGMLLRTRRVLLALGVVALAVMFGSGAVSLGRVLVVLSSRVVFIFGHVRLVGCVLPSEA
jgi:hypothetical protein